jgi:hypothetical protein
MSVSAVCAGAGWFATAATSPTGRTSSSTNAPVDAFRLRPNDPLNQHLTQGDRDAIKTATGVDIRSDGGILLPASLNINDYEKVLDLAGSLAASRANGGAQTFSSDDAVQSLLRAGFTGDPIVLADEHNRRVDFRA